MAGFRTPASGSVQTAGISPALPLDGAVRERARELAREVGLGDKTL